MLKSGAKARGNVLPLKGFGWIIRSYMHFRTNFNNRQFDQRDHLNAMNYCPQQLTYLHDVHKIILFLRPSID